MERRKNLSRKIKIQVSEIYSRNVNIIVELDETQPKEMLDELLDELEDSSASYETLLCDLENKGIKITEIDDSEDLFMFENNDFTDYIEVDEREE